MTKSSGRRVRSRVARAIVAVRRMANQMFHNISYATFICSGPKVLFIFEPSETAQAGVVENEAARPDRTHVKRRLTPALSVRFMGETWSEPGAGCTAPVAWTSLRLDHRAR
jgi:hypothetical protein